MNRYLIQLLFNPTISIIYIMPIVLIFRIKKNKKLKRNLENIRLENKELKLELAKNSQSEMEQIKEMMRNMGMTKMETNGKTIYADDTEDTQQTSNDSNTGDSLLDELLND